MTSVPSRFCTLSNVGLLSIALLASTGTALAQPTKIVVNGGSRALRQQVVLLLQSAAIAPAAGQRRSVATISLKPTGAHVKWQGVTGELVGTSAEVIVQQFDSWLPAAKVL